MEDVLDDVETDQGPDTNYKKWAFRLFVYVIIINLAVAYLVASFIPVIHDQAVFVRNTTILSILSFLSVIAGTIFTFLSYRNQEKKDYQYQISIWGYPIFIALSIILLLAS
ncbi:MAG: hypothetical protein AAFZ63_23290 [Bacteroidota bacterium]